MGGAEQVGVAPERVRGQVADRLALPDQQREVVREDVGEADRDQRVGEAAQQLAVARNCRDTDCMPRTPSAKKALTTASASSSPRLSASSSAGVGPSPRPLKTLWMCGLEGVPDDAVGRPVEGRDADDQRGPCATVPGSISRSASALSGRRRYSTPSRTLEQGEPREQVEVAAERVAALGPRLDPEQRHADEHQREVGERQRGERHRVVVVVVDQLEPAEREQSADHRPAAEPRRIRQAARVRVTPSRRAAQRSRARERAPGAERAEHVAGQHARNRHADPEDDDR